MFAKGTGASQGSVHADKLKGPSTQGLATQGLAIPLDSVEAIRAFYSEAVVAANEFTTRVKDATGKELKEECSLSDRDLALIDDWMQTKEGRAKISEISNGVISFMLTAVDRGHPGHDRRHVLYKDPLSALRMIVEEGIEGARTLFLLPSLLHDSGRLLEPKLSAMPQGGVEGVDHAILGFLIIQRLVAVPLASSTADPEQAQALQRLGDELLNAVLDHQGGNSRKSFFAQAVQRADREQLVGSEGFFRMLAFDVGFNGLSLGSVLDPGRRSSLPLPGKPEDQSLLHHAEFYMRNLFRNIGATAERISDSYKIESGRLLWLASTAAMREQIFAPEYAFDAGASLAVGQLKPPLAPHIWRAIRDFETPIITYTLREITSHRSLYDLAREFVHPTFATRCDMPPYGNWERIVDCLDALNHEEQERMRLALTYGLILSRAAEAENRGLLARATKRFADRPDSPEYKVTAMLCHMIESQESSAVLQNQQRPTESNP